MSTNLVMHAQNYQNYQEQVKQLKHNLTTSSIQEMILNPNSTVTVEIISNMIRSNPSLLLNIPNMTEEACIQLVKQQPINLRYMEDSVITEAIAKAAVQKNGCLIPYVPVRLITQELCEIAFRSKVGAISFIPEEFINEQMIISRMNAVDKDIRTSISADLFKLVPDKFRTKAVCEVAVKNYGYNIVYVPEVLRTDELRMAAILSIEELGSKELEYLANREF